MFCGGGITWGALLSQILKPFDGIWCFEVQNFNITLYAISPYRI